MIKVIGPKFVGYNPMTILDSIEYREDFLKEEGGANYWNCGSDPDKETLSKFLAKFRYADPSSEAVMSMLSEAIDLTEATKPFRISRENLYFIPLMPIWTGTNDYLYYIRFERNARIMPISATSFAIYGETRCDCVIKGSKYEDMRDSIILAIRFAPHKFALSLKAGMDEFRFKENSKICDDFFENIRKIYAENEYDLNAIMEDNKIVKEKEEEIA